MGLSLDGDGPAQQQLLVYIKKEEESVDGQTFICMQDGQAVVCKQIGANFLRASNWQALTAAASVVIGGTPPDRQTTSGMRYWICPETLAAKAIFAPDPVFHKRR